MLSESHIIVWPDFDPRMCVTEKNASRQAWDRNLRGASQVQLMPKRSVTLSKGYCHYHRPLEVVPILFEERFYSNIIIFAQHHM